VLDGSVQAFIGLGGNFVRAVPETGSIEAAWRNLGLTVQVATKLNRSHLVHGKVSYLLPCLGRIEVDEQHAGEPGRCRRQNANGRPKMAKPTS
jgi:anaerobic selenocysteine-containing dehydrogenase